MVFEIIEDINTYSGSKSDEYPLEFCYKNSRHRVAKIVDRWYESGVKAGTPVYNYFKILTYGDKVIILRHNLRYDSWAILIR